LAESGAIEQDADVVLFLHREHRDATEAKLVVAAHRHGDTGTVTLQWHRERTQFEDPTFEWTG
jgi:replicative DNA helicase